MLTGWKALPRAALGGMMRGGGRGAFDQLSGAPVGTTIHLHRKRGASLEATIVAMDPSASGLIPASHIEHKDPGGFIWQCTNYEWETAELLEPFLQGQSGHQYLTTDDAGDTILAVSFGKDYEIREH